jgi:molybdate transport system permease protein
MISFSTQVRGGRGSRLFGGLLGGALVLTLVLPLIALGISTNPTELWAGALHPAFAPALLLSLRTTACILLVIVITGTPLAWWLATSRSRFVRTVELLVELPIVVPPAVIGVALLRAYGRRGILGPAFAQMGISLPFTEGAVILAQVIVSAPFFVQAGANAFRRLDQDMLLVARTLGASSFFAFARVAVPIALPGLIVGASLAWARSLGEFGATLLFAGNSPGSTQTMPLAIFSALESDLRLSVVFSLVLIAIGAMLLVGLRSILGKRAFGSPQDAPLLLR